jgi:hypothetical protein
MLPVHLVLTQALDPASLLSQMSVTDAMRTEAEGLWYHDDIPCTR